MFYPIGEPLTQPARPGPEESLKLSGASAAYPEVTASAPIARPLELVHLTRPQTPTPIMAASPIAQAIAPACSWAISRSRWVTRGMVESRRGRARAGRPRHARKRPNADRARAARPCIAHIGCSLERWCNGPGGKARPSGAGSSWRRGRQRRGGRRRRRNIPIRHDNLPTPDPVFLAGLEVFGA